MFRIGVIVVLCALGGAAGQERRDRAVFVEEKNAFLEQLKERSREREKKKEEPERELKMDLTGLDVPGSVAEFTQVWHQPEVSQGITGNCWAYASTSLFESEVRRLSGREVKLSEPYTVYWEYVEKARRFVRERGKSEFGIGSESNATPRIWKEYGVVPLESYRGLSDGDGPHDDTRMSAEMRAFLNSVKDRSAWNEEEVSATIRSILDHYMGRPPVRVPVDGAELTPREYLSKVVGLNLDDYVNVMSLMERPYHQKVEYNVPDNWWHSDEYLNLPLDEFLVVVRRAVRKGYSLCLGGDTSEPGYYAPSDVAVVPTFDIPAAYIDESARQLRFSNESTTDDHAVHLVGYLERGGLDWYLVKDSSSHARNGRQKGYVFYHEDFVKLKTMTLLVHRDMVEGIPAKPAE